MRLPPLVEPGPALTGEESLRTARQTLLPELGEIGQRRLAAARIAVIGAGGLGAPVLSYLAAAGVGTIAIIDDDVVDLTNLHRQVIHAASALGEPKVASAARRLREVAPAVVVETHRVRLEAANAADLLRGHDLVIDGTDTFATRYLVSDTCADLGLPLVWGSVLRFDAQVSVFWSRPPGAVPGVTLRDLFPQPPAPGTVPSCAEAGVLGALCGIVGSMMATEAIKLIVGIGDVLLGRVAVVDALTMRVHDVPLVPSRTSTAAPSDPSPAAPTPQPPAPASDQADPRALPPGAVLLDVREPSEYDVDGLPGAVNLPVSAILQTGGDGDADAALRDLLAAVGVADDAPLVAYCAAGIRAARAARPLTAAGRSVLVLSPEGVATLRASGVAVATAFPTTTTTTTTRPTP